MPVQNPFHIWAQEAREVLPFDSAGRIEKWYLDRFQSILAQFKDVHPNAYTLAHYRAAFNSLEKSLAQEREAARLKVEADCGNRPPENRRGPSSCPLEQPNQTYHSSSCKRSRTSLARLYLTSSGLPPPIIITKIL